MDGRDHTTVIHSCQVIKDLIDACDDQVLNYVDRINRSLNRTLAKA
jgi:chromosomal replication initiation ATPase DnaA